MGKIVLFGLLVLLVFSALDFESANGADCAGDNLACHANATEGIKFCCPGFKCKGINSGRTWRCLGPKPKGKETTGKEATGKEAPGKVAPVTAAPVAAAPVTMTSLAGTSATATSSAAAPVTPSSVPVP